MHNQHIFEQINGIVGLLNNFRFDCPRSDCIDIDNFISDYTSDDLTVLEKHDFDPYNYSIRQIINKITQLIHKNNFDLGRYLQESRNITTTYPLGYLIFDYCLAALYGNKTDASLYASHIFYLFRLDREWHTLFQWVVMSNLVIHSDVRKFLIVLAVSVKPISTDLYILDYPQGYANRLAKLKRESNNLNIFNTTDSNNDIR